MDGKVNQLSNRLLDFVVKVITLVDILPNTTAGRHIGGQLVSAGTSSGANYEEGCGAESRADFIHKMSVSLKELKETRYWLKVIERSGLLAATCTGPLLEECEHLCAMLGKSVSTARKNRKKSVNSGQ